MLGSSLEHESTRSGTIIERKMQRVSVHGKRVSGGMSYELSAAGGRSCEEEEAVAMSLLSLQEKDQPQKAHVNARKNTTDSEHDALHHRLIGLMITTIS